MTRFDVRILAPVGITRRKLLNLLSVASAGTAFWPRFSEAQEQSLNLFTYPTYANSALIALGNRHNFNIKTAIYAGADEMMAKLRGGGTRLYDMVVPLHTYVPVAANANLIEPMNPNSLPNLSQVSEQFKSVPGWTHNGKFYGVPFVWGANAIAYNFKETGPIDSMSVLFDDKFKGRVAMRDDVEDAIAVGALYLGIKDPFDLDEKQLQEIKKVLIRQKANNRTYWRNIADLRTMFANGEIVAAWATLSVVAPVRKNGIDIRWVWPKEGALGWTEGIAAVKGTQNISAVEAYANFTVGPEYGETLVNETRYAPTSSSALKNIPASTLDELGIQPESMKAVLFKKLPPNRARWQEIWTEVKAS